MSDLDARLLAAHARDDRAALVALYTEAADLAAQREAQADGSAQACWFYLTQAYVFALETGHPAAPALRARLAAAGRETP